MRLFLGYIQFHQGSIISLLPFKIYSKKKYYFPHQRRHSRNDTTTVVRVIVRDIKLQLSQFLDQIIRKSNELFQLTL